MNSPQFRYERIIWSPECGGCLMIQRKYWKDKKLSDWQNYASQEEGSYPVYDAKAKKAVKLVNRWRRAQELMLKAEKLRKLANELEFQADELKKNHENSSPDSQ